MRKVKVGDIYAIPLPNGKYAFGRVFKDAGFGIYRKIEDNVTQIPDKEEYQFIVSIYKDLLTDGEWIFLKNKPFNSEDDMWPPKRYIKDKISGCYSIYYKGEITPSTEEECANLEVAAVWDRHHLIDRIMGVTKWN